MELYWVSCIIHDKGNKKPYLLSAYTGELSLEKAMETISLIRKEHRVLSAWVDIFNNNKRETVFHECYINVFGDLL